MRRSRSAPARDSTPFEGCTYTPTFSPGERDAERLYYAAISTRLCKGGFVPLAKHLARNSPDGSEYLSWLIMRGQQWPTVSA